MTTVGTTAAAAVTATTGTGTASRSSGCRSREDVTGEEIDKDVRQELMSLPKTLADDVAKQPGDGRPAIDEDPEQAYAYSRVALRLASRVAAVREAAGFAAYATQKYAEALAEFRAARRMTGNVDLWPVMADCERGLGRPERALDDGRRARGAEARQGGPGRDAARRRRCPP